MIETWFNTPQRRIALAVAAEQWIGTPFHANSSAPGRDGGVDCVRLGRGLYHACGALPWFNIPRQTMDHGQHSDESLLLAAFRTWPELTARFCELGDCSPTNILPGDALCFRAGRVPHHAGYMVTPDSLLHAIMPSGVHLTQLRAAIRGQKILGELVAVFRPRPC